MAFKLAVLSCLSLAAVAFAVASGRMEGRHARRRENCPIPPSRVVEQSDNAWTGAVLVGSAGTFTSVSGTFTMPDISGSNGDSASVWVGIDGYTCGDGLLQTGVDFTVEDNGTSYDAWYEWAPAFTYYFDFDIHSGDVITTNVTAYSATSGIAIIENQTTGKTVTQTLSSPSPLCNATAEWIIEDYTGGNGAAVPFGNFGTLTFVDAVATGPGGTYKPCDDDGLELDVIDLTINGEATASVKLEGCNITITHV